MSSNHSVTHQAHKNGLYIVGVITTSKALFKGGQFLDPPPLSQVGLTYGWKNKKQSSGPIELDLEAGNLVSFFIVWTSSNDPMFCIVIVFCKFKCLVLFHME